MSMIGNFAAATDIEIARLLAAPDDVTTFLYGDEEAGDHEDADDRRAIDVDKAWHGLHFLLTGDAWAGQPPLDFIVNGGEPIGDVDVGYGPARAFTSDQVRAIAAALAPLAWSDLIARWDAGAMRAAEIYGVDPEAKESEGGYLGSHYGELTTFVTALAADGLGMIVFLN